MGYKKKFADEMAGIVYIADTTNTLLEMAFDYFMTAKGNADSPYYTLGQAAKRLHVTTKTIMRWVKAGKLKAYRKKKQRTPLFLKTDIDNYTE